jgi:hypothetical protein
MRSLFYRPRATCYWPVPTCQPASSPRRPCQPLLPAFSLSHFLTSRASLWSGKRPRPRSRVRGQQRS